MDNLFAEKPNFKFNKVAISQFVRLVAMSSYFKTVQRYRLTTAVMCVIITAVVLLPINESRNHAGLVKALSVSMYTELTMIDTTSSQISISLAVYSNPINHLANRQPTTW